MSEPEAPDASAVLAHHDANFDELNRTVEGTSFDRHLRFLNFGYRALPDEDVPGPDLPRLFPNADSARLVFALLGDADLAGARVLDVGCGRGGPLSLVARWHEPAVVVGLDLVRSSAVFCARSRFDAPAAFLRGDAQVLPVADAAVDGVLNLESSCCYPDVERFYREVARVLRPGGRFFYSDVVPTHARATIVQALARLGLEVEEDRDITANVLAARDERAARQKGALEGSGSEFGHWMGVEGSRLYHQLTRREHAYVLLRLRRTDTTPTDEPVLPEALRQELADKAALAADALDPSPDAAPDDAFDRLGRIEAAAERAAADRPEGSS